MLLLLLSILLIIVGTVRFKVHPFLVLFVVALAYGLLAGMPVELVLQSVKDGFGGILGNIGLVIVMGVIIGAFLEHTGGAQALASKVLSVIGEKKLHSAMGLIGYIVSIPVFCDSGFIILHPLNKALSRKAGKRLAGTAIALALGLLASHAMVPPTPGPIAAAGIIGANLGLVILAG
ncbi:MAG: GntP family permease, partial [Bacteroidetes bacterium]